MRLKKLEISGFKSFVNKTTLEFPVTISAIVGPNGSGKSNVADSVRWVLGEQSFKNLRSKSGVDLIWAGSAEKSAQSKASVNLYFDNHDGFFPIDFEEVVIGRKIYRDGANEYYLNDSQVRLKDIVELLARSKLGLRGHSIVNQGSADELLKANSEERRGILEESLGLREFQLKKSEAEAKLLETGSNLEQTAGLINEIFPKLKFLKRQVDKFQKRDILVNDLDNLENEFFKAKIHEVLYERNENQREREKININAIKAKENFEVKDNLFKEQMAQFSQTGEKSGQLEMELEQLNAEKHSIIRELGRLEGIVELTKKNGAENTKTLEAVLAIKIKYWAKHLDVASKLTDAELVRNAVKNIADEIGTISGYLEEKDIARILSLVNMSDLEKKVENSYEKDREDLKIKLNQFEEQSRQIKEALSGIRLEETAWRGKYSDFQKELEIARREHMSAQERARALDLKKEKVELKEADIKSAMWSSGKYYEEFCTTMLPTFAIADTAGLENKIIKLRREIADIGSIDEETIREYEETNKRHEFLAAEFTDLGNAMNSLKNLIQELTDRINNDFKTGLVNINESFDHYFKLMFNGGSSKLTLENNKTGVAINVSVPKKRIKDLNLLSGGERSLVSIALLFAIVSVSQPPFLVLDEIDAALDENNAVRFAKVLKNLAEKTQFVLITHNRATMETADVLYGVTMGGDGVSKLFSLKLQDAVV